MVEIDENTVILGPGAQLKEQREILKISIEEISKKLRLDKHIIEKIEVDDYSNTLPRAYLKGYLRNYAKEVNLNEEDLLKSFNGLMEAQEDIQLNAIGNEKRKLIVEKRHGNGSGKWLLVIFAVVIGIVLWFVWQTWTKQASQTEPVTSIELQQKNAVSSSDANLNNIALQFEVENASEDKATDLVSVDEDSSLSLEESEEVSTQSEPKSEVDIAEEDTGSQNQQSADTVRVTLVFSGDSWVDIKDKQGNTIVLGLKEAGHISRTNGVPPFDISLGDASVVTMSVAGKNVDLSSYPAKTKVQFTYPKS